MSCFFYTNYNLFLDTSYKLLIIAQALSYFSYAIYKLQQISPVTSYFLTMSCELLFIELLTFVTDKLYLKSSL